MSGQEIAERTPMQTALNDLRSDGFKRQIEQALPGNVSVDRFVRVAATAIQQEPKLITVERESLFRSIVKCAQDGLLPDGREAALVIFGREAVYLPMIGGFRKIAAENGWALDTQVVYANDEFDYELGVNPVLKHKPPRLGEERGDMIGAYAVGTHIDGRKLVEVFTRDDVMKVKKASKTPGGPLWTTWENRAWEKSVGRRWFAKMPRGENERMSERVSSVLAASDSETEFPGTPSMALEEANLSVATSASIDGMLPDHDGPDDGPLVGEVVE